MKKQDCSHRTQSNPIQSNPIHGWIQSMSNSGLSRTRSSLVTARSLWLLRARGTSCRRHFVEFIPLTLSHDNSKSLGC